MDDVAGARYARGLFQAAQKAQELEKVNADLVDLQKVFKSSGLQSFLENPRHSFEKKKKVLTEIGKKLRSRLSSRFLYLLLRKARVALFGGVLRHFASLLDEATGTVPVEVTLGGVPNQTFRERLEKTLRRMTQKKVRMTIRQDAAMIGGIMIKIKNEIIDGSIRSRLQLLKKTLLETRIN